jgi:tetratricopeptide (TPR) repeat protein
LNGRFSRLEFEKQQHAQTGGREQGNQQFAPNLRPGEQQTRTPIRTAAQEIQAAVAAYQSGRFDPALQHYTRALGHDRALVPAWVGQVQMLVELTEYHEARLWSDKALELFRNNGDLLAAKSRACLRQGDAGAAMQCSDASLQAPGISIVRWQARGEVLLSRSAARARDCFEKSLAEPAADWFDRIAIARMYLFHDYPANAYEYAQAAAAKGTGRAYCWLVLGQCQEALGWTDEAARSYERCLALDRTQSQATSALVNIQNLSGAERLRRWFRGVFRR